MCFKRKNVRKKKQRKKGGREKEREGEKEVRGQGAERGERKERRQRVLTLFFKRVLNLLLITHDNERYRSFISIYNFIWYYNSI